MYRAGVPPSFRGTLHPPNYVHNWVHSLVHNRNRNKKRLFISLNVYQYLYKELYKRPGPIPVQKKARAVLQDSLIALYFAF